MYDVIGMPDKGWLTAGVHHLCLWQSCCLCFQNVHRVLRGGLWNRCPIWSCASHRPPFSASWSAVALCIWAWTTGYLGNSDWDTDVDRVTFWFSFSCPCRVCHPLAEPPACICTRLLSPATWPYSLYRTTVTNRKQLAVREGFKRQMPPKSTYSHSPQAKI